MLIFSISLVKNKYVDQNVKLFILGEEMRLMSLDVGFGATGYVVWENKKPIACGVVKTEATTKKSTRTSDDNANRSMEMANAFKRIIEEYEIKGIIGELPSGGGQSARAISHMALATGIISAVAAMADVPCEWCTPIENKKVMTGKRSASKEEMMDEAIKRCGGVARASGRATYYTLTNGMPEFPGGSFEHIADAVGVYYALEHCTLVKLLQ